MALAKRIHAAWTAMAGQRSAGREGQGVRFVAGAMLVLSLLSQPALAQQASQRTQGGAGSPSDSTAPHMLAVGDAIHASVAPGTQQVYRMKVPAGHVIQADFNGRGVTLDLQDAQRRHLRRLGVADAGTMGLMWIASAGQRLVVRATGSEVGQVNLTLTRSLAPAPQGGEPSAASLESPRLRALQKTLDEGGDTDAFWREMALAGTPLIEPLSDAESLVTFLWQGEGSNIRLFGSPSGNHDPLARLGDSDVWWTTFRMPNTARLSYRIAPDVPLVEGSKRDQRRVILATAQRDPLNPHVFPAMEDASLDVYQGFSVLTLPDAPPQPWVRPRVNVASGSVQHYRLASRLLGNERDVWIYRPTHAAPEALLVMFDGQAYRSRVPMPVIMDNLIADGLIPPTAMILIANPGPEERGRELPPNKTFGRFLGEELMPWARMHGLAQPAAQTVIGGSSYGGLAAAYAGLMNSRWFGNILSLSGSYWWSPEGERPGWMMRQYAQADKLPLKFYLDAGRYEATRGGHIGILETSRHFGDVLRAKGYPVTQVEHDTGHDYLHWQGSVACGLVALLNPGRYAQGLKGCE
nr:enterochelin esterase domain-containing protein [Allopusillimonas soli]